jgi:hypothetical protein
LTEYEEKALELQLDYQQRVRAVEALKVEQRCAQEGTDIPSALATVRAGSSILKEALPCLFRCKETAHRPSFDIVLAS